MYNQFQSRIIIIGASGLIGSHLSNELVRNKIKPFQLVLVKI